MTTKFIGPDVSYLPEYFTDGMIFIPILDPDEFQARAIEWKSPLYYRVKYGRWQARPYMASPIGRQATLLVVAAWAAFFDVPLTGLRRFATELKVDNWKRFRDNVIQLMLCICCFVLKDQNLNYDQKIELCRLRQPTTDAAYEILTAEDVSEMLDDVETGELGNKLKLQRSAAAKTVATEMKVLMKAKKEQPRLQPLQLPRVVRLLLLHPLLLPAVSRPRRGRGNIHRELRSMSRSQARAWSCSCRWVVESFGTTVTKIGA